MKLRLQTLDRSLVLWLIAAIVTIAGFCMPAPANAHSGHGHDGGAPIERVKAPIAVDAKAIRSGIAQTGMGAMLSVLRAEAHLGCAGPCCTGPCGAACCCALGLAPAESDGAAGCGLTAPVPAGAVSARNDVAPDSPSEPPRPFA